MTSRRGERHCRGSAGGCTAGCAAAEGFCFGSFRPCLPSAGSTRRAGQQRASKRGGGGLGCAAASVASERPARRPSRRQWRRRRETLRRVSRPRDASPGGSSRRHQRQVRERKLYVGVFVTAVLTVLRRASLASDGDDGTMERMSM